MFSLLFIKSTRHKLQTLKADLCNCYEKNKVKKPPTLNKPLQGCLDKAFENSAQVIANKAVLKYGKEAEAKFEHFTIDIFSETMVDLVTSCDRYYTYMDSSRFYVISKDKDSLRKMIQYRTYKMDRSLSANFYYYQAEVYFELGDYTHAFKDIDSSLITNPDDYKATELKGEIMELQHNYNEALQLYEKAYRIEHSAYMKFLKEYPDEYGDDEELFLLVEIAVLKRKMKEGK
ncbi:tetratricopeptide repeat protein [Panacibacter sp. DH6]|uniref:Tetratricopeptide repeat protein n=1 Tax=Panacibacter microcysteis TaxID=2793269 RepID=A0A931EAQ3_9BACT|nr:tetratricopeptide repeat protein [Panacibacter microcysteis]MBG9376891.1 tetratricopeptide repeat protein [Panacibacter microcysteis]